MYLHMLKSKIHRAIVTDANLNYEGSITIDEELLEASDIKVNEKVQVVNNNNGARIETYVIKGERGSGTICLNGAAARHFEKGDVVIIIAYCMLDEKESENYKPKLVFLNEYNGIERRG